MQSSPVGYGTLVRQNANFRYVWFGQIISLLGDWFDLIASASLLATLTKSATAVGGLFVVRMLAPFVVTPIAGVLADRFNRKHLLIISDLMRGGIVLCFLLVRRPEDVWLLYVITGLQLGFSGVYFPARSAILPDLVTQGELGAANALSSATWSVMLGLGAGLGGLAAGQFGVYPSFVLDALTFFVSAFLQSRITYTFTPHEDHLGPITLNSVFGNYIEGLRYLRHNLDTLFLTLHKGAISLIISGPFQVITVALSQQAFMIGQQGGTSQGIMFAVFGIGTGIGPIIARFFTGDRERPQRIAIGLGYLMGAIGIAVVYPLASFETVLLGMAIRGMGMGTAWVFSSQILLQILPNRVRGRVFSSDFAIQVLMNAIGSGIGGYALDSIAGGIPTMLGWMGFLALIPGALWMLWITFGKITPPDPNVTQVIRRN